MATEKFSIARTHFEASSGHKSEIQLAWMLDPLERKILSAFDRPGARTLPLAEFGETAEVHGVVASLVEQGWLRGAAQPDTYERAEDGRLQLAGPRDVTIYSRPGCHLCEEAKSQIAPLLEEFGAALTEINIDEDPILRARYDYDVPVIVLGARKAAKHRVDLAQFRRQLRNAVSE
jgi:glutaredoxin